MFVPPPPTSNRFPTHAKPPISGAGGFFVLNRVCMHAHVNTYAYMK